MTSEMRKQDQQYAAATTTDKSHLLWVVQTIDWGMPSTVAIYLVLIAGMLVTWVRIPPSKSGV
jgi:hypothetical protein